LGGNEKGFINQKNQARYQEGEYDRKKEVGEDWATRPKTSENHSLPLSRTKKGVWKRKTTPETIAIQEICIIRTEKERGKKVFKEARRKFSPGNLKGKCGRKEQ